MKKQIIIHTDEPTHSWLKGEAKANRRTLGNQILAMLIGNRLAHPREVKTKRKGARA